MRPGPRTIQLLAALCAAALLIPWVPPLARLLPVLAVLVFGAMFLESVLLRRVNLSVERRAATAVPLDEECDVPLRLRTDAPRAVRVTVRQSWPRLIKEGSTTHSGLCRPGETLRFAFRVRGVVRGTEPLAPPNAAVSMWGFAERITAAGEPAEITVLPNLNAVRRLHGQLNQFYLRGLGSRVAPRLGKGREFDRLREYRTDDDFRDIAWKASARHGKLIVREYRLDRAQDVVLCVDRGHRMAARVGDVTKVDHAVNGAALMAYICDRMEDRVGILSFAAEVETGTRQGRGSGHLRRITAFATGVKPEYIHTDYLALTAHLRRRCRQRALILIMTDLPEGDGRFNLIRAVKMLTPQHLPLIMILSDPGLRAAGERLPADKRELCQTLVARDVWTGRQQTIRELRHRGALVVDTLPHETGIHAVNAYIDIKRRQLL